MGVSVHGAVPARPALVHALPQAELLAEELRERGQLPLSPRIPIDHRRVLELYGLKLHKMPMEFDGQLLPGGERFATVLVNSAHPRVRQRFTIAHELAHWSLRNPVLRSELAVATRGLFGSEEVLCNSVAGALLMPRAWLEDRFSVAALPHRQNLEGVRSVGHECGLSPQAAVIRLHAVFDWQFGVLHWTRVRLRSGEFRWVLDSESGIPRRHEGVIRPARSVGGTLDRALAAPDVVHELELPLVVGGEEIFPKVEVIAHDNSALAHVPLRVTSSSGACDLAAA
jgi:hypothetical protein